MLQGIQRSEAQITDTVALILTDKNIARSQIGVQISVPTADRQSGAQIQAQIDSGQMGHGFPAEPTIQAVPIAAEQIDIVAGACFHRLDLPTVVGQKAFQLGQLLQNLSFLDNAVSQFPEIVLGGCGRRKSACQQQSVQTPLRSRNGNDLKYVFAVRIFLHGGIASHTVVLADGLTHHKLIQKRTDQLWL